MNFMLKHLNEFWLVISVDIRDVQTKDAFLQIHLRKLFCNLVSMPLFHYDNNIGPYKLLLGDGSLAIQPCRFSLESV
jgi:hypothetical protein